MTLKMLATSDPHETGIAILEDDRLTEIFIERLRHRGIVGNIYKGRVNRVLPGMQAAFVDIGLDRDAFLYVSDIGDGRGRNGEALTVAADGSRSAAGVAGGAIESVDEEGGGTAVAIPPPPIEELIHEGQELVVQVLKAPLASKGARITTHITLPGRYLVLLPGVLHVGISRRIEDEVERQRLLELMDGLVPAESGLIVRTVGEGKGRQEFEEDRDYLLRLWQRIRSRAESVAAPKLVHRDIDLALRVVRDLFNPGFDALLVDDEETYTRIVEFLDQVQPSLVGRVKLASGDRPLFERFGIPEQIEGALRSKVWLKSGGYIVVNQTEALVAIDVNTGRYVGRRTLEETALKTNLEAVRETVRQIRLRDLGGIIVVDFIDMLEAEHRNQVFELLEQELEKDRAKTKVLSISEFGLVEITRKRSRTNLERLLTQPCPHCSGSGRIKSIATICLDLRRELLALPPEMHRREVLLRVHPDVAAALQGEERAILDEVEEILGLGVVLQRDASLHHEQFDVLEV